MGTNFYMITKNKSLADEYFFNDIDNYHYACGYELVDEPYFGYKIHICKRSYGWVPLFQKHDEAYKYFSELEVFYHKYKSDLDIYDEYNQQYSFTQFKKEMIKHSQRKREPIRWVFCPDAFSEDKPILHTEVCTEEETELYIPIRHDEYAKTEAVARKKYKVALPMWLNYDPYEQMKYERDPNYDFDWIGEDFR